MNGALHVARLEIIRRWQVLAAGLVAGLLPLAAPLVFGGLDTAELRWVTAGVMALSYAVVVGSVLGATMIAPETADGRVSFFFARPVSGLAIWAGKLLGTLAVLAGAVVALLLPSLVMAVVSGQPSRPGKIAVLPIVMVVVVVVANALSVAWRSRSRLLVADAVAVLVLSAASVWLLVRLLESAGGHAVRVAAGLLAGVLVVAATVAGALQVIVGRVDLRRGHRVLSATLALGALGGLLAVAGFSRWYTAVDQFHLDWMGVLAASPAGPWVTVSGRMRHRPDYEPTLLVDVRTGVATRLERCDSLPAAAFSRDGRFFAWVQQPSASLPQWVPRELSQRLAGGELRLARLEGSAVRVSALPVTVDRPWGVSLVLSDDGGRLALLERRTASVIDIPSGNLVASVTGPGGAVLRRAYFLGSERLRVMTAVEGDDGHRLEILDLDLATKRVVQRHSRELDGGARRLLLVDRDSGRMLLTMRQGGRWWSELADAATGRTIAALEPPTGWAPTVLPQFVSGGRTVVGMWDGAHAGLGVYDGNGGLNRLLSLPAGAVWRGRLFLGGEVTPGELLVICEDREASFAAFVVELEGGAVRPVEGVVRPSWWPYGRVDPSARPEPGGPVSRLVLAVDGRLRILDPETLELHPLSLK